MLKKAVKKFFLNLGYVSAQTNRSKCPSWASNPGWDPEILRNIGTPQTIVDVGVAFGTHELYKAFPNAYHVLVEPLVEFEPHLKKILTKYKGQYFLTAVGAKEGTHIINVEPKEIIKSSLLERTSLTATGELCEKRKIPVTTLDKLFEENSFRSPFGLKLDVEGFELQVIEGASRFLQKTEFVIAEVSVAERFGKGYSFIDFLNIMNLNKFRICEILRVVRAQNKTDILILDAVFKKVS